MEETVDYQAWEPPPKSGALRALIWVSAIVGFLVVAYFVALFWGMGNRSGNRATHVHSSDELVELGMKDHHYELAFHGISDDFIKDWHYIANATDRLSFYSGHVSEALLAELTRTRDRDHLVLDIYHGTDIGPTAFAGLRSSRFSFAYIRVMPTLFDGRQVRDLVFVRKASFLDIRIGPTVTPNDLIELVGNKKITCIQVEFSGADRTQEFRARFPGISLSKLRFGDEGSYLP